MRNTEICNLVVIFGNRRHHIPLVQNLENILLLVSNLCLGKECLRPTASMTIASSLLHLSITTATAGDILTTATPEID